jgi:hypothetical protein
VIASSVRLLFLVAAFSAIVMLVFLVASALA